MLHEESQRLHRMCRELRNKHALAQVLTKSREATLAAYNKYNDEQDDFNDIFDPPHIHGKYSFKFKIIF